MIGTTSTNSRARASDAYLGTTWALLAMLGVTTVLAVLSWQIVEKPALLLKRRTNGNARPVGVVHAPTEVG